MDRNMLLSVFNKLKNTKSLKTQKIVSPKDAFLYLSQVYEQQSHNDRELFFVVGLNKNNEVTNQKLISIGDRYGVEIDRGILIDFLETNNPAQIIISHNHPSGRLAPSSFDLELTDHIRAICLIRGIILLDHIIYCGDSYFSFVQKKQLPKRKNYSLEESEAFKMSNLTFSFSSSLKFE